ncbi:MAG TPA: hypothetical protein DIV86_00295 [Alphaproteobacteria bacterium]|nr:hypothetical protein [Alphaproteobacteria bacterium]
MTIFDIFAAILTFSLCAYGFGSGVMTLILRVFTWYGAMILTIIIYPLVKKLLLSFIPDFFLIGYITVVVCGAIFAIAVYFIVEPMLEGSTAPKQIEKLLGTGAGLLLALLLLGTTHFITLQINREVEPSWINGAKILPVVKKSSNLQAKFLEDNVNKILFDLGIK